jgi:hypothetical protein
MEDKTYTKAQKTRNMSSTSKKKSCSTSNKKRSLAATAEAAPSKKARLSHISSFPPVLSIFKQEDECKVKGKGKGKTSTTVFDDIEEGLSSRACQLWRCPSGAVFAASNHRPAGVCRKLGVVQFEFDLADGTLTDNQINNLLKDTSLNKSRPVTFTASLVPNLPSQSQSRRDVIFLYGKDYHKVNGNVTQTKLMQDLQKEWPPILAAGAIVPQWNKLGQWIPDSTDSTFAKTSCRRLLALLKNGKLIDPQPDKVCVLYNGIEHIPTDAMSVLEALVEFVVPSKDLYEMPLLMSVARIRDIQRPTTTSNSSGSIRVNISVGVYANRLLFETMTQQLRIIVAALDEASISIVAPLSPPPSVSKDEPVFVSDPNGPQVYFDYDDTNGHSNDSPDHCEERITVKNHSDVTTPQNSTTEFEGVGASDGTLDAFSPSGFLKLIENTGVNMENYEAIENKLEDKLQVELMLHQRHALSYMYKMEHLERGINSLIWEERSFPEGDRYFYSPVLGQLRLSLGENDDIVRGGIVSMTDSLAVTSSEAGSNTFCTETQCSLLLSSARR